MQASRRIFVPAGLGIGPEQDVEDREERSEIPVGVLRFDRMMQAMPLRACDERRHLAQRQALLGTPAYRATF
ncbi:MAG TPA: hypothetical protein PLI78_10470, partial [Dokdonella sp.]|nr:hypothetical protein [Dokdonella sp.]